MSQDIFFISAFRLCSLFGSRVNQATSLHSLFLSLCVCVLLADDHEAHFFLQSTHSHLHTKTVRATLLIQCCLRLLILTVFCLSREILIYCLYMCVGAITFVRVCVCVHTRTHTCDLHHCKSKYWLYCFHDLLIPSSVLFEIILCLHIDILSLCVYMIVRAHTVKESWVTPGTLMAGNGLVQSTKEKQSAVALTCPNTHL